MVDNQQSTQSVFSLLAILVFFVHYCYFTLRIFFGLKNKFLFFSFCILRFPLRHMCNGVYCTVDATINFFANLLWNHFFFFIPNDSVFHQFGSRKQLFCYTQVPLVRDPCNYLMFIVLFEVSALTMMTSQSVLLSLIKDKCGKKLPTNIKCRCKTMTVTPIISNERS